MSVRAVSMSRRIKIVPHDLDTRRNRNRSAFDNDNDFISHRIQAQRSTASEKRPSNLRLSTTAHVTQRVPFHHRFDDPLIQRHSQITDNGMRNQ